jgi:hypothetical protein
LKKSDFLTFSEQQISSTVRTRFRGLEFMGDFISYMQSQSLTGLSPGALENLTNSLRKLTIAYADNGWLFPVFVYVVGLARRTAVRLDVTSSGGGQKWQKKIVEIFREIFPIVHKEREKLAGTCWIICQLLSLYMALDQVRLCHHILAALTQSLSKEGGFNPQSVPKSISVTLFYYWGRFHVMESKYLEAHEKLIWAYQNCPPVPNRKRIAEYLIPSMVAIGIFPRDAMMNENRLEHFVGLTNAIKTGDVGAYNHLMNTHAQTLAKSGTLILMEKCKLLCYRNLAKRIFLIAKEETNESAKFDIDIFEAAWKFAEGVSRNEIIFALSDLIYAGAMKGYIALEHNKIVLSKANPFPKIDSIL